MRNILIMMAARSGEKRVAEFLKTVKNYTVDELKTALQYRHKHMMDMEALWKRERLDAVIGPVVISCAFQEKNHAKVSSHGAYSAMWNYYAYPSGVVPVTTV